MKKSEENNLYLLVVNYEKIDKEKQRYVDGLIQGLAMTKEKIEEEIKNKKEKRA